MQKKQQNIIPGVLITLISILIYIFLIPTQIKIKEGVSIGPDFFPKIAVMIIGLCSLFYTILQIKQLKASKESVMDGFSFDIKDYVNHIVFIASGLVFLTIVRYLGFPITVVLFLIFLLFFFGSKGIPKNIIIAVIYGIAVYALFSTILKISFPDGIFGI